MEELRSPKVFNYAYSINEFRDDSEINVAEILVQLPYLFLHKKTPLPSWGFKRKRSAINVAQANGVKSSKKRMEISSPQTPFSFSPSESDCRSKQSKQKSLKKTQDKLREVETRLLTQNAELKMALKGVLEYHKNLKAKNKALCDLKRHLELKFPNGKVDFDSQVAKVTEEKKPVIVNQTPFLPIKEGKPVEVKSIQNSQNPSNQFRSRLLTGVRESVNNRLKKNPVPDLNCSVNADLYTPLALRYTDTAVTALARRRRYEMNKERRSAKLSVKKI